MLCGSRWRALAHLGHASRQTKVGLFAKELNGSDTFHADWTAALQRKALETVREQQRAPPLPHEGTHSPHHRDEAGPNNPPG